MYLTHQSVNYYQRWQRAYRMNRQLKEQQGRPFPKWTTLSTDSSAWRCDFLKTLWLQGIAWARTDEWNKWSQSYWWPERTCTCTCTWYIGNYQAAERTNRLQLQLLGLWQCETKKAQIYIFFCSYFGSFTWYSVSLGLLYTSCPLAFFSRNRVPLLHCRSVRDGVEFDSENDTMWTLDQKSIR